MNASYVARVGLMSLVAIAGAILAVWAASAVGVRTHDALATAATELAILSVVTAVVIIGSLRLTRAREPDLVTRGTRFQLVLNAALFGSFALAVGAEVVVYRLTHARLVELATAVVIIVPSALVLIPRGLRAAPLPKPRDAALLRVNATLQCVIALIFSANLALWWREETRYPDLAPSHECYVAMAMVVVLVAPITAVFLVRRARTALARESSAARPA